MNEKFSHQLTEIAAAAILLGCVVPATAVAQGVDFTDGVSIAESVKLEKSKPSDLPTNTSESAEAAKILEKFEQDMPRLFNALHIKYAKNQLGANDDTVRVSLLGYLMIAEGGYKNHYQKFCRESNQKNCNYYKEYAQYIQSTNEDKSKLVDSKMIFVRAALQSLIDGYKAVVKTDMPDSDITICLQFISNRIEETEKRLAEQFGSPVKRVNINLIAQNGKVDVGK